MPITHAKVSTHADGPDDTLVRPSDWNEDHVSSLGWANVIDDFGAFGDGGEDDTAAIQAAVDSMPPAGGTVFFPPGEYKITSTITLRHYVQLRGVGTRASLIRWAGAAGTYAFTSTDKNSGAFYDIQIAGRETGSHIGYGLLMDNSFTFTFQNTTWAYLERGVVLQNNAGDSTFAGCYIRNGTIGMIVHSLMNYWLGGAIIDCVTGVTNIDTFGGLKFSHVTFAGVTSVRNIDLPYYGEFSFSHCWFESATTTCARIGNGTTGPNGTTFTDCHFHTAGSYNLDLQSGPNRTTVLGCYFVGPRAVLIGATHLRSVFIANGSDSSGNITITDNAGDAVVLSAASTNFLDVGPGELRGGSLTTGLVVASKMTSVGVGIVLRVNNNTGVDTDVFYAVGGVAGPYLAIPVLFNAQGAVQIDGNVGFYGTAPGAKPTVTGSRGGNAALASLLTGLAARGLITDSSS